ncbi:hypothetical protein APA22_43610 (plasmid) [Acetobacter pasteurianus IFO 3283-22]|uniref:Uncharacterized protein n=1 Tax=Acetobacter pasteurianus (strain NBRC 105184 / IFO 3283-01) TaxID=634452 RepID=C7JJ74_ACEP3|nr:hypothetical protein APA01_43610 [Acetobacter pasteurianus IFO 3283-01]BAI04196.1 hypothetical protein APA03_43610 [Acetobacter pasteurianus IFO 3283-03]BAI07243.1 hypothetical protein APA07_43610 [Acetobacter pasteurianus IFO 3283-07]BAI10291.1 hypothetical protein APA22_43610 [Acetobacter pasteurianus IFO 3283-22]BAI13339.1 hypothetical protein APA26_43610 [Acetobacter pasteurianus IFO 3283-26]BAI16385.1 hypothetical protein APA32_43610 [Acetobacter pasteurianus IFO 3283-32]BAI19369.1 hy
MTVTSNSQEVLSSGATGMQQTIEESQKSASITVTTLGDDSRPERRVRWSERIDH